MLTLCASVCPAMQHGLEEPGPDVVALVSHATQERLKTLLEQVAVIAEHRMEVVKVRLRWPVISATRPSPSEVSRIGAFSYPANLLSRL